MFGFTELALLTTLTLAVIVYFKWTFGHWKRKNIAQIEPRIPFGNAETPFNSKKGLPFKIKDFYGEFKSNGHKHGGFYLMSKPVYIPIDTEYIKNILARDFQFFVNRGVYYNEKSDPLSANLFSIEGPKWRHLRSRLTPTFTSGKMKMMFQTVLDCGEQLKEKVANVESKNEALDIKETVACFTTDVIGSCAFGLECNSLKNPDAEFRKYGKKVFTPNRTKVIKSFFGASMPKLCKFIGMTSIQKDVSAFFMNAMKNVIEFRQNNDIVRNDFVQILLNLKNKKMEKENGAAELTFEEMAAQAVVFFVAGYETSSTAMTFCFYELAKNQLIQQKLRDEVHSVLKKYNGKLTYEAITEMKYMGQVIDETLRKYPSLPALQRICTKDYRIPNTDTILEARTKVVISVVGLHYDTEYYPDPNVFDPDRFTEENNANRHSFAYLPFGEGPRNCIGLRFGLMQMKIGISLLLQDYKFTLNMRTPDSVRINAISTILFPVDDVFLNVEKI